MDKEELKFLKRVNSFVMIITIILDVCTVAGYGAAYATGTFPLSKFMVIIATMAIGLLLSIVFLFKDPVKFRYVAMIGYAVLYSLALAEAGNDFMFVLVFPMITMYILYFDYKLILASCVFFSLANIVDMVYIFNTLKQFRSGMELEIPVTMLRLGSVIIYSIAVVGTTLRSNRNNAEKIAKTNSLLDIIVPIVKSVSENSTSLSNSVDTLDNNMEITTTLLNDVATYNTRNTKNIEEQSIRTNEIQSMIAVTKTQSDQMIELSGETRAAVNSGQKVVSSLISQANETKLANEKVEKSVTALINNALIISQLTENIGKIADQTNILATNASIESARAGAAGKGFAVISQDVRRLADNTNELTKRIQAIIEELDSNAKEAEKTLNGVLEQASKEHKDIKEAEKQFNIIENHIGELANNIDSIYTNINEIMNSNEAIVASIQEITNDSEAALEKTSQAVTLGNECKVSTKNAKEMVNELSATVHNADSVI